MQDYENDALNNLKKILINKWDFVTMQAEEQVKPVIPPKPKPFRQIKVCVVYLQKHMGEFHTLMQIMQEKALFSGKIYIAGKDFARPPVMTVATFVWYDDLWYIMVALKFRHCQNQPRSNYRNQQNPTIA